MELGLVSGSQQDYQAFEKFDNVIDIDFHHKIVWQTKSVCKFGTVCIFLFFEFAFWFDDNFKLHDI